MISTQQQPAPGVGDQSVTDLVIADLHGPRIWWASGNPVWLVEHLDARRELGRERYGTELRTLNGRKPLVDAWQESIDLVLYLRQDYAETSHHDTWDAYLDALHLAGRIGRMIGERGIG